MAMVSKVQLSSENKAYMYVLLEIMKYKFLFTFCNKPFLINCLAGYDSKDLIPCKTSVEIFIHVFFQPSLAFHLHVLTDTLLSHSNLSLSSLRQLTTRIVDSPAPSSP